jgi:hypothetical protein
MVRLQTMIPSLSFLLALTSAVCCSIAQSTRLFASAFQPSLPSPRAFFHETTHRRTSATKLDLTPEIIHDALQQYSTSIDPGAKFASILLSAEGEAEWRQYVPLAVSCAVILDILLGSPLANAALGPMKRASEKGASGNNAQGSDGDGGGSVGGSLFSNRGSGGRVDRSKERVDSEAIAKAALFKAINTLELKRFLEENKTDEQQYEEVRKKIDRQMSELD